MKFLFIALFFISLMGAEGAQDDLSIIAVGEAESVREKMAIPAPALTPRLFSVDIRWGKDYHKQLVDNFSFYRRFFQITETSRTYQLIPTRFNSPDYSFWSQKSVRYLIHSLIDRVGQKLEVKVKVFDVTQKKELYSQRLVLPKNNRRYHIHRLSDRVYGSLTGKPSIFGSQIAFISDLPSRRKKVVKELYVMDFDGHHKQQLTRHGGIVISPAFSPDQRRIVYGLIRYSRGKRNMNLHMLNLKTKKNRLISSRPGMNSGAIFSSSGKSIYLTMSYQGNAEIYEMDLRTSKTRRVTRHRGEDVDPSLNREGNFMAFLSSRPGKAMIYVMDPRGTKKNVRRISYTGKFNATPRFAPSGKEMAFASWVDNRFDLYRISIDGNELTRLTRDFGSNESPSYSRDGEFITFSSQRVISRKKAEQNLYIMDRNGSILGRLTDHFGKCQSPRWSK